MAKGESVETTTPILGARITTREEALALGPEQSHRIIAVLEEAAEKLGFLGSIMPDVLQHRDELSKFVGDEISRIIQVRAQNMCALFRRRRNHMHAEVAVSPPTFDWLGCKLNMRSTIDVPVKYWPSAAFCPNRVNKRCCCCCACLASQI